MKKNLKWMLAVILTICGAAAFASCAANDDNPLEKTTFVEQNGAIQLSETYSFQLLHG
jgi:hypothetical protein